MARLWLLHSIISRVALAISDRYFRAEVRGWENVPQSPCLFVGNHNCGAVTNPEAWIFGSHFVLQNRSHLPLKALSHDLILKIPGIRAIASRLGCIPAHLEIGVNALKSGHPVLVYPGGGWESCRPSQERDRIDFKGRSGFVRLARIAGAPIVPIVAAGAHDGWHVWTRGDRIARLLRLDRLRIDVFPIGMGLPFGLVIGPIFPFLPLPRKIILHILPPISVSESVKSEDDERRLAKHVVEKMQSSLDELVKELPRSRRIQG